MATRVNSAWIALYLTRKKEMLHELLLSQKPSHGLLDMTPNEVESYLQTTGVKTAKTSFKRFVRFLMETGRMEYGQTEELRQMLK